VIAVDVKIQVPDLAKIPKAGIKLGMRRVVQVLSKAARQEAPRRTGILRKRIGYAVRKQGMEGVVRSRAPHTILVLRGTKTHRIPKLTSARRAGSGWKILRFAKGGQTIFARRVLHPGAKENPFLLRAAQQSQADMELALDQGIQQAIEEAERGVGGRTGRD
jgi:hypothetical protein